MTTTQRRNYPGDYQRDAVALVTEQAYSIAEAARNLAVGANLLERWQREYEVQAKGETLDQDEREELKRLRRENRELRMEKEILKKGQEQTLAIGTRDGLTSLSKLENLCL